MNVQSQGGICCVFYCLPFCECEGFLAGCRRCSRLAHVPPAPHFCAQSIDQREVIQRAGSDKANLRSAPAAPAAPKPRPEVVITGPVERSTVERELGKVQAELRSARGQLSVSASEIVQLTQQVRRAARGLGFRVAVMPWGGVGLGCLCPPLRSCS